MAGSLIPLEVLRDVARLGSFRNIDDLFQEFSMTPSLTGSDGQSHIRMDVDETEQAYFIEAEIPGAKKDDIKIAIDGSKVSISAEVKQEKEEKSAGNTMRKERYYGQQYRSFTLPHDVDADKAEAKYQDGILSLSLPKKEDSGGKQLMIQ